ncbi:MAG TPA: ArsA-related P-loop ATPase, partial [Vicinamibacterales bacterium]|nr:ArsA-related P-loop ATPase [Vicinamibacterales bacterium]
MSGPAAWRFFGGKGGVGKTTCAAAAALEAAAEGARVLALSTDPAHSLRDALGAAARRPRLRVVEIDAARAYARWLRPRRAALAATLERGTIFDRDDVERLLELALPGLDELVALLEIARAGRTARADLVVVDTAPTGHTL